MSQDAQTYTESQLLDDDLTQMPIDVTPNTCFSSEEAKALYKNRYMSRTQTNSQIIKEDTSRCCELHVKETAKITAEDASRYADLLHRIFCNLSQKDFLLAQMKINK
uniref:Uncharacterized protein n=1 Tax=Strigamia maritima TaxID=126957 RepID=T1J8B2_STRMM